jgi:hypothetical protein
MFSDNETLSFSFWHLSIYNLDFNALSLSFRSTEAIKYTTFGVMAVLIWLWYALLHGPSELALTASVQFCGH